MRKLNMWLNHMHGIFTYSIKQILCYIAYTQYAAVYGYFIVFR